MTKQMKNKKKIVWNGIFLFVVFGLTLFGVFHGEDLGAVLEAIHTADIKWLIPGAGLVGFFIWCESIIIWYMMHSYGIKLKKSTCFLFSSAGFFFSCITPSASGGQPMQIYYMKRENIPIPVSTVILMIVTITYKLVLVVIGAGIFLFGQGFVHHYLGEILPVYYLGLLLNIICVAVMTVLVFYPALVRRMLTGGISLLKKTGLMHNKSGQMEKLEAYVDKYQDVSAYLKSHIRVIAVVFVITFVQRAALFAATWFVYKSFGLSGISFFDVTLLQGVISVSVDMLPLPGGMGISESLFLKIFVPVFGAILLPGMVLSRGLGYYTQLLISAVFTVVAQLKTGQRREIKK